jgi:translation initiation factor IF-1
LDEDRALTLDKARGGLDNVLFRFRRKSKDRMSKEDLIELQGVVSEVLAGGNYKIKISDNHEVLARLNGKMRQFRIRVIQGDRVTVGVSPYDLKRGLITYRAK